MQVDVLIDNVRLATLDPVFGGPWGEVADGALALCDGRIVWLGTRRSLPACTVGQHVDGRGGWLTPGLIDCHTHLVWAGNRAAEFAQRCAGIGYADIARAGGGIRATVTATRAATEEELLAAAVPRLHALRREGVTTVEIKSGYGLDLETELRMLRVARRLGDSEKMTISTTLLAAHALPEGYEERPDAYIDWVCDCLIPTAHAERLVDAVDVFCEGIGFDVAQCERVYRAASRWQLAIKAHVEQLSYLGGAKAAARHGAVSVDHLEYLPAEDVPTLLERGAVAVLLPGAFYFLRETRVPPVVAMREAGLAMAVASDLNPGSSPMASLLVAMNQACVLFGLRPDEALRGVTRHAARALGLADRKGILRRGMDADLLLWEIDDPAEISYGINLLRPRQIWQGGRHVQGN